MTQQTQTLYPHVIMVHSDSRPVRLASHTQLGKDREHAARMFVYGMIARGEDVRGVRMYVTGPDRRTFGPFEAAWFLPFEQATYDYLHAAGYEL